MYFIYTYFEQFAPKNLDIGCTQLRVYFMTMSDSFSSIAKLYAAVLLTLASFFFSNRFFIKNIEYRFGKLTHFLHIV